MFCTFFSVVSPKEKKVLKRYNNNLYVILIRLSTTKFHIYGIGQACGNIGEDRSNYLIQILRTSGTVVLYKPRN